MGLNFTLQCLKFAFKTYEELRLQICQYQIPSTLTSIHDDLHLEDQSIQLASFCWVVGSTAPLPHMLRFPPFLENEET